MKKLRSPSRFCMVTFILGAIIVLFNSCEKPVVDDFYIEDSLTSEELYPWQDLIQQLDIQSEVLFVQNGESIQDVIDAAKPGSVIYIEPGIYNESISTSKSDIKLIGFSLEPDDITIKNADKKNIEILNLHDKSNFDKLRSKSFRCGSGVISWNIKREDLGGKIAHYSFDIKLGKGRYDVITIHRVVKENKKYKPIKTKGDVFMVHGAIQDFDDIFLTAGAESINSETSSPYYLASNRIDVWGIDMGWTKVPVENENYDFMRGWGMEKDIDHALTAMSIARLIRGLTRQGFSRMNLLGFSYGVHIAFGAASRETQQHWLARDVKGIIPVDSMFKTDDKDAQTDACGGVEYLNSLILSGQYNDPWGVDIITMGNLALYDPDGDSPFYPGLTNSQFLMFVGSQGFFTADPDGNYVYTDPMRFIRMAVNISPHWPMQVVHDFTATKCPRVDVSHDDYLSEISVPILYIGAGEGSEVGFYAATLTASADTDMLIVDGYSHADLWFAYEASNAVWEPLSRWLKNHR